MQKLILAKHALPEIDRSVPASRWRLSEEGRRRCKPLADRLVAYQPALIVSSVEPKATETAEIIADQLCKPFETAEGLHEHDRRTIGFLSKQEFEGAVTLFFDKPEERVFGQETAAQAHQRFKKAVGSAIAKSPDGNIVIVAHGTVITLFVAECTGIEPFSFWQRLGLPSFVVLSLPDLKLIETVESVE